MTLTLELTTELQQRLAEEARRRGVDLEGCTMQLLHEVLPPTERSASAVDLLQSWIDAADPDEQKETGDRLAQAFDEHRTSDRPLFPPPLEGKTW